MNTLNSPSSFSKTPGKIFVFSAASGAGKTTLLNHLKSTVPNLVYSISATTRKPRRGERNGEHYFFMKTGEFKRKINNGEFAEWAVVHGNYYGTPRRFIDDTIASGKHIIMDIDVFGKKKFDAVYPNAVGIFLVPPSIDVLRMRLEDRQEDSDESIAIRIANASKEMAFAAKEGKYEYTVVNDDLQQAKADVVAIVKKAVASK
jgi:guanylate kinase